MTSRALLTMGVALVTAGTEDVSRCDTLTHTKALVGLLAQRTRLMKDVAALKGHGTLVFSAAQELRVLESAAQLASSHSLPVIPATILAQLLADCAKQEQAAHLQDFAGLGTCESGQASDEHDSPNCLTSAYHSLDEIRAELVSLQRRVFELWRLSSGPLGEWNRAGCQCVRSYLKEMFSSDFQSAARGGCASQLYSDMLVWTLLSASSTCQRT